jgi:mono/diheme cytochrome c family protein
MIRPNVFVAALVLLWALTVSTQLFSAQADSHPALPAGEGRDVMIRVCSQCHEPEMAADQQLDAAGWRKVVDQMAANGATGTDAEFEQIVQYLAKAFPPAK